jgi:hypothetical protein
VECAEIHLATGFQNLLYDHPAFPADLRAEIEAWVRENAADERKPGETDQQFIYKTRKKALGPFKRRIWELDTKDEIIDAQEKKVRFLMEQLKVQDTKRLVERYIDVPEHRRPAPPALREAISAA